MPRSETAIHVLLTHPFFWPHVTRGAEREVHDAGAGLAGRGHRVDLVTGQPTGLLSRRVVDGVNVRYVRTPVPALLVRRGWRAEGVFGAVAAVGAALSRADVVVSYLYADALGASFAGTLTGRGRRPVVLKLTGAVPRWWVDDDPVERGLLRRALERADEVWVNSAYAAEAMADWGHAMRVVPAGVDTTVFAPSGKRAQRPTFVCAAAPDEPRKRLTDVFAAWPHVLDRLPDARLVIAQTVPDDSRRRLLDQLPTPTRGSVAFVGRLDSADLAAAYSTAWVSVAPAVYEALGLATIESLGCGTAVVGARSGATAELLDAPGVGALYEPGDAEALAAALVETAGLAAEPTTPDRCRAVALRYSWPAILDRYEERFTALLGR